VTRHIHGANQFFTMGSLLGAVQLPPQRRQKTPWKSDRPCHIHSAAILLGLLGAFCHSERSKESSLFQEDSSLRSE
jgi:hypothetical protein